MMRWLLAASVCAILSTGCDQHQPTARRVAVEGEKSDASDSESAHPKMPKDSFHGSMPKDGFHGQMPGDAIHAGASKEALPSSAGPEVALGPVRLTAPKTWNRKQPRVDFIRGEFSLPKSEGDKADGRLTVSTGIRGTLQENVERWRVQFVDKPEKESQEKITVSGIEVTLVDLSGTYKDQKGMMGPAVEMPGYRMLGAIFDVGGELYFIKAYGPAKTLAAQADAFRAFVQSLKRTESK
jgi:hypothetical protein